MPKICIFIFNVISFVFSKSIILFFLSNYFCIAPTLAANLPDEDYIVALSYWEDLAGQADINQAKNQVYTSYTGLFSKGYNDSVHWIRITLAPSTSSLTLVGKPTWLDSVTLYAHKNGPVTLGDLHPVSANLWAGLGYAFEVPASATQHDVWLRLKTTSSHVLMLQVIPSEKSQKLAAKEIIYVSIYACIQLLIFLILLFTWMTSKDILLGRYLIRYVVLSAYGLSYLGVPAIFVSEFLNPNIIHYFFAFLVVCAVPASLQFEIAFLKRYKPNNFLLSLLKINFFLSFIPLLLLILGFVKNAMQINIILISSATALMFFIVLSTLKKDNANVRPNKKIMFSYYFILIGSLPFTIFGLLGGIGLQGFALYGVIAHGLITGSAMAFFLLIRSQYLASKHQLIAWELQQERVKTEIEQKRREEQSQFLHMLMHEIKTPLSIVSMALGSTSNKENNFIYAHRAVQDMNAILERCVQADQIGEFIRYQHQEEINLLDLVLEVVHEIEGLSEFIKIKNDYAKDLVKSDRQILKIIVLNLLSNCYRYRHDGTPVFLSIETHFQKNIQGVRIKFSNIPGMAGWPQEDKIFKKYYRSAGAQRQSGCGLGLYLSRQLSHTLSGQLEYVPSERLVEFELWIPVIIKVSVS